jgi:hypothetical protein
MGNAGNEKAVTVRLCHGEKLALTVAEADQVFDELWLLSGRRKGAVTAAAKLKFTETWSRFHGEETLTEPESVAFREAFQRVVGLPDA